MSFIQYYEETMKVTSILLLFLYQANYISTYHIQKEVYWHCFDIYEIRPNTQNVTLLCSDTFMEILDINYIRPLQIGDSVCTNMTYSYEECCKSWINDNVKCIVPYADDTAIKEKCEHQSDCDILLEPMNMYTECQDSCSNTPDQSVCWSRGVEVIYVCYTIDVGEIIPNTTDNSTLGPAQDSTVTTDSDASTTEGSTQPVPENCECSAASNITSLPLEPELITLEWLIILVAVSAVCFAVGVTIGWWCTRLCSRFDKGQKLDETLEKPEVTTTIVEEPSKDKVDDIENTQESDKPEDPKLENPEKADGGSCITDIVIQTDDLDEDGIVIESNGPAVPTARDIKI